MVLNVRDFDSDAATIRLDRPGRNSFGSGRLIAQNLVLTARHVVEAPGHPPHDEGWTVRLQRDRTDAWKWHHPPRDATVIWRGKGQGNVELDLALLRLADAASPSLRPVFSAYRLATKLDQTLATGFPEATWTESGHARSTTIEGRLAAPDDWSLAWSVDRADAPDQREGWSGMSGAVLAREGTNGALHLFGAVQEVPPHFSQGQLKAARIADALADADFQAIMTAALGQAPELSEWRPADPAPPAWPSPLAAIVHLFDRQAPADWVAAQIGPGPVEMAFTGLDEDMLHLFVRRLEERTLPGRDAAGTRTASTPDTPAARREVVTIDWTGYPTGRLRTGQWKLRQCFNIDDPVPDFATAFRHALQQEDHPAWVNLHVDAHLFKSADVVELQQWRRLWHEAARAGSLPRCGIIYTVAGVTGALPPLLKKALKPLNGRDLPIVPLPECSRAMFREWTDSLRDWRVPASLQVAAGSLGVSFGHDRFRLGTLDHYLRTGTLLPPAAATNRSA